MCLHRVVVHSVGTTAPSCFVSFLTSSSLRQLLGALLSDKMNAEDERETPGEYRVKYTEEELNDFFYKELRDKYIAFAKTKYPEAVGI